MPHIIIWLLHNLVEASFDLFRYLLLGDQLETWELHPLHANGMALRQIGHDPQLVKGSLALLVTRT